jgi:hypothetical protein
MNLSRGAAIIRATQAHESFVCKAFRESLVDLAGMSLDRARAHERALWSQIRSGITSAVVAVPIGHPETFIGWAAQSCGSLLFAYVPTDLRGSGTAGKMAAALFDRGPVRLVYWTDVAEAIREHGFPLVHDWREFRRRERLIDRALAWQARQTHNERAA